MTSAFREQKSRRAVYPPLEEEIERGPGEEAPDEALKQVPLVRRAARQRMTASWGLPGDLTDDVSLLLGELLNNAVLHGRGNVVVKVGYHHCVLSVSVSDQSPALPRSGQASPDDKAGRGWAIAQAVADEHQGTLTVVPQHAGKAVMCVLPVLSRRATARCS
ncbi:ATP-binding protein [Streptomyces chrestomyceticus]|uniref:ATP-binding protein n=1 Tax=Streptomyces chrestomyceticus TaxID=68185 RepID=UPI0033DCC9E9